MIAARRSPIGRAGGRLRHLSLDALAAPVLRAALDDAQLPLDAVDEVVLGNVWGPGGNPARVAALRAGLAPTTAAMTVDRQCASGLDAVNTAAHLVTTGAARVCLAGGVESPSTAPWRLERPAAPTASPRVVDRGPFTPEAWGDPDMGPAADTLARAAGIDRARQDAFALRSHQRALQATTDGRFAAELVAMGAATPPRDEGPRARLTAAALARLRPAFTPDGTVTAGNASALDDGAAAVVVVADSVYEDLGRPPALRVVDGLAVGGDPRLPGAGPIDAVRRLLARHRPLEIDDLAAFEITEAFAGQALACLDALGIDEERANRDGGAIALGHPWGASGAVLVVRLFSQLARAGVGQPGQRAIATIAAAGGQGVATLLERTP